MLRYFGTMLLWGAFVGIMTALVIEDSFKDMLRTYWRIYSHQTWRQR